MKPAARVLPGEGAMPAVAELFVSPKTLRELLGDPETIGRLGCADVCCVVADVSALFSDAGRGQASPRAQAEDTASRAVTLAEAIGSPNAVLSCEVSSPQDEIKLTHLIDRTLNEAACRGVTLLIETRGIFSETARLIDLLDTYSSDNLAAYWLAGETFARGESADTTIGRLGAYVRAVDSGAAPSGDLYSALRSIDYKGSVTGAFPVSDSPAPPVDLSDPSLLDMTFPQLLDDICARFPGQLAFDYSLSPDVTASYPDGYTPGYPGGYTRTYPQFRDDVDECARALIALGVRPGTKVAVWLTNIPQWYIVFWASVKIGAVLVTVNTAYKIREAEYLLRQADVHTLIMIDGYKDSRY
ncbi:MAG: AMP-binding protein, partial [Oscillospiraceae bacterium]|nr:AMP-binding protein [Oscillospiraceae bacterium]